MRDRSNANLFTFCAIDERVGEAMQWKEPSLTGSRCAKPWIGCDESCSPSKLRKKRICY